MAQSNSAVITALPDSQVHANLNECREKSTDKLFSKIVTRNGEKKDSEPAFSRN